MTDKEQIMINGECIENCPLVKRCPEFPRCKIRKILKQLSSKTQECEELKEENQRLEMQLCNGCGERDDYNIPCKMIRDLNYGLQKEIEENDRYAKALEEIEKVINNILNSCLGRNTAGCRPAHNVCGDLIKILDIINKVKEEI